MKNSSEIAGRFIVLYYVFIIKRLIVNRNLLGTRIQRAGKRNLVNILGYLVRYRSIKLSLKEIYCIAGLPRNVKNSSLTRVTCFETSSRAIFHSHRLVIVRDFNNS